MRNLPTNKNPGPDGFIDEFYHIQRINVSSFQTLPENRRRNTSRLISQSQHYPDTKTRQECHKETKILNIIG